MTRSNPLASSTTSIPVRSPTTCLPTGSSPMKRPRLDDFDPNSLPTLHSPIDELPAIRPAMPTRQPPAEYDAGAVATSNVLQPSARPPLARPSDRPPVRPSGRRSITRYAFEFFQDQVETLRALALEEK